MSAVRRNATLHVRLTALMELCQRLPATVELSVRKENGTVVAMLMHESDGPAPTGVGDTAASAITDLHARIKQLIKDRKEQQ